MLDQARVRMFCGRFYGNWNGVTIFADQVCEHDVYVDVAPGCGGAGTARGTWRIDDQDENKIHLDLTEKDFLYFGTPKSISPTLGTDAKKGRYLTSGNSVYEFREAKDVPEGGHKPLMKERPLRREVVSRARGRGGCGDLPSRGRGSRGAGPPTGRGCGGSGEQTETEGSPKTGGAEG